MVDASDAESLSREYFAALLHADSQALDNLLAPDFWLVEPLTGWKVSRSTFFRDVGSGVLTYQELEPDSLLVRRYDGAAIVIGSIEMKGQLAESEFALRCRYTHVFVCRGQQQWQLASAQETPIETWGRVPPAA